MLNPIADKRTQIADFVRARIQSAPSAFECQLFNPWRPQPTVEELAKELVQNEEFRLLRLGAWLTTPDGELIAQGVALALPPYLRPEYGLWLQAMQLAAHMQQEEGQQKAAGRLALAATALISAAVVTSARRAA